MPAPYTVTAVVQLSNGLGQQTRLPGGRTTSLELDETLLVEGSGR
jgi:hypothetical protein